MGIVSGIPVPIDDELYPSSDGQPMAETELHGDEMTEMKLMLRRYFRDRADHVYVGCNLFVYYEKGNPGAVFSPDVFVVQGAPQKQYDTYKLWQDGPPPCWVLEVSSKKTHIEDRGNKKAVCEMLGVAEYFLYDPRAEYLTPPLQGLRLHDGRYEPIVPDDCGRIPATTLGLSFSLGDEGLMVVTHTATGERLLRNDEELERAGAERDRVEAERDRVKAERDQVKADREQYISRAASAEARLAEAMAELARLKGE